jgi:hypothetical protein
MHPKIHRLHVFNVQQALSRTKRERLHARDALQEPFPQLWVQLPWLSAASVLQPHTLHRLVPLPAAIVQNILTPNLLQAQAHASCALQASFLICCCGHGQRIGLVHGYAKPVQQVTTPQKDSHHAISAQWEP